MAYGCTLSLEEIEVRNEHRRRRSKICQIVLLQYHRWFGIKLLL